MRRADLSVETGASARTWLIVALILSYAHFAILLNSVGTVILQSINGFGVDKAQASTLEAFKDLPIAIVSLAVAAYLPRFGFRRALILGQALVGAGCLAMALFPGFGTVKLLFLVTGVSFALVKTATYTIIGLLTDDARGHAALTNRIEGMFMVGVLGGYWLFGLFIDPAHPGDPVWLHVYWVLAAISAGIMLLLLVSRLDESRARDIGSPIDDLKAMGGLIARPAVMLFAAAAFLYVLVEQGVGTWLPTFNAEVLHLSAPMSVQGASLFAAALALGRLGAAPLVARIGWLALLGLCIAGIMAVVLFVVPLAEAQATGPIDRWSAMPWTGYAMPMIGLFLAPIYPTINSAILSALPRTRHSAMTGLLIAFSALGGTTGSFITGRVFAALGGVHAFRLIVVPAVLLGLVIVIFDRQLRKARLSPSKDLGVSDNANQ